MSNLWLAHFSSVASPPSCPGLPRQDTPQTTPRTFQNLQEKAVGCSTPPCQWELKTKKKGKKKFVHMRKLSCTYQENKAQSLIVWRNVRQCIVDSTVHIHSEGTALNTMQGGRPATDVSSETYSHTIDTGQLIAYMYICVYIIYIDSPQKALSAEAQALNLVPFLWTTKPHIFSVLL